MRRESRGQYDRASSFASNPGLTMLGGSIVAIVTPMTEGGEVDFAAFERLLDWHLDAGTDGVVVVGTTGESPTVTEAETARLLRAAVERIGGRIPVIAGTGSNSTAIAVARTRAACA
ncbi:MAG: dihydrodipicolinate synthase family protein, partial [Steroidobacteraceae bacterium]|nr:dihydrodipicolinate synthase family protein [Steroidobacteraceae bacterium]